VPTQLGTDLLVALRTFEIASLRFACSRKLRTVCDSGIDWCTLWSEPSSDFPCTKEPITWSLHTDLQVTISIQIYTRIQIQIVHWCCIVVLETVCLKRIFLGKFAVSTLEVFGCACLFGSFAFVWEKFSTCFCLEL